MGVAAAVLILFSAACGRAAGEHPIRYVATIQPLAVILEELVAGRATVARLLSPGASPHTFEPTPSDIKGVEEGRALFFGGPGLDGEWISRIPARNKVEMLAMVPAQFRQRMDRDHHHGEEHGHHQEGMVDPHFWTDPLTVKAMIPALVRTLTALDPGGGQIYAANGKVFATRLDLLHVELGRILAPIKAEPILLFHPSFNYLIRRYQLTPAGVVIESPGREPTPKSLLALVKSIKAKRIKALFTEPQLGKRPAKVLAEAAGVPLYELDPLGGPPGRTTYGDLLLHNGATLIKALR